MERYNIPINVPFVHRVCFTKNVFSDENDLLSDLLTEGGGRRAIVFVEKAVTNSWKSLVLQITDYFHSYDVKLCHIEVMEGGEVIKANDSSTRKVWELIEKYKIDRHSYVLCIGGGAFLDAIGFGATTAHRGVRFVRFPTTTLSQDDSGVGVKNGINSFGKKNWIGTFSVPYAVINDFEFLKSQDPEVSRIGLIEAIKVALVKDADFFEWIEKNVIALNELRAPELEECVKRSALLHATHIADGGDSFEMGSSRPLDFGHWSAHKLEQLTNFELSHAAAVSIGMVLDTLYSERFSLLDSSKSKRIFDVLRQLRMPLYHEKLAELNDDGDLEIIAGLEDFREHLGGKLTVLLLKDIGTGIDVNELDYRLIENCIVQMQSIK
jgi:3-dehydroquinate synthase